MTSRDARFKQAAWAYLIYGVIYLGGAIYLARMGIGARGMTGSTAGVLWFVLGFLFIIVFPWLISKGAQAKGYLWFTRILTLLVAYRAFEVGRVMLAPRTPWVPLPGGGELPMIAGAALFFLVTLGTAGMLARAAWSRQP
jgi:hypothetical protein